MSDASHFTADNNHRPLRLEEKELIKKALGSSTRVDLDALRVVDALDGGMGGIRVATDDASDRVFGSELARFKYTDTDGVPVSITLNADKKGYLFEIDFWKIDFSPLLKYPSADQIERGDP